MNVDDEAQLLSRVPTFAKCDPARLKLLAFTSRVLRFAPGDLVLRAGEPSDSTLLILEGTVEFVGHTDQGEFIVNTAGANQMIGEMGVIMDVPRTLTVRARTGVRVLRISSQVFLRLLSENPEVALDMMKTLCERLQSTTQRLAMTQQALVDCGGSGTAATA